MNDLDVREGEDGRFYRLPSGNWAPSVTTVLGKMSDQRYLDEWRDRIGHEEAERYTYLRARIGNNIHDMFEKMLLSPDHKPDTPYLKDIYRKCSKDILSFSPVLVEQQFWSETLCIAGRCDLITAIDNDLMVVDFKSYKKYKTQSQIKNYVIQATLYGLMAFDCGKVEKLPTHGMIYATCEHEQFPQIVKFELSEKRITEAVNLVNRYWNEKR